MGKILGRERHLSLNNQLDDPRICMFSCFDAGGTDGSDDWMLTLCDAADKYGRMGVNIYSSVMQDTELKAQLFLNCRLDGKLKPSWGNLRVDEALCDKTCLSASCWGRGDVGLNIEILALSPGCFRLQITLARDKKEGPVFEINPMLLLSDNTVAGMKEGTESFQGEDFFITSDISGTALVPSSEFKTCFVINTAFSKEKDKSLKSLKKSLKTDIGEFRRLQHKVSHPAFLEKFPADSRTLARKIHNDLRCNIINYKDTFFSAPNRVVHKGQWLWDTCFHLFPLSLFDMKKAETLIKNLFIEQQANGFIPISFSSAGEITNYATQPPLIPYALAELFDSKKLYRELYPKLKKFCAWFEANRQLGNGLFHWNTAGESGMDNSPRFDPIPGGPTTPEDLDFCGRKIPADTAHIDISAQMALFYSSMAKIAEKLNMNEDSVLWEKKFRALKTFVNEFLYDSETGFYYDRKLNGDWIKIKTVASLWVLEAGIPAREKAEKILKHIMAPDEFFTPVPIPSVAINEESFCLNYWRGPVWCNIFFITYKGMKKYGFEKEADCLAGKMLDGVMREWERSGHLWELYDPFGGKAENMEKKYSGPRENARLFAGWTACLLNVIMERPLD